MIDLTCLIINKQKYATFPSKCMTVLYKQINSIYKHMIFISILPFNHNVMLYAGESS